MTRRPTDDIGKRVARYRRIAGLSARELAERAGCGLTRGVIANLESGRKTDITVDQLFALSVVLGIPPLVLALPLDAPYRHVALTDGTEKVVVPVWLADRWVQSQPDTVPGRAMFQTPASPVARQVARLSREYVLTKQALLRAEADRSSQVPELRRALDDLTSELSAMDADLAIDEPSHLNVTAYWLTNRTASDGEHQAT